MQNTTGLSDGKALPLMEAFHSIQGEGFYTGTPAYFLRIGGCDVGCAWCDAKESWNAQSHPLTSTDEIINAAIKDLSKAAVITGGEPLLYNLDYLCAQLKKYSFKTFLETSGSYPLSGKWDWICLSPKRNAPPLADIYNKANELKVIIYDDEDFAWAEKNAAFVKQNCILYLQPEWKNRYTTTPKIIDYISKKWNISLQMHKYMGIP